MSLTAERTEAQPAAPTRDARPGGRHAAVDTEIVEANVMSAESSSEVATAVTLVEPMPGFDDDMSFTLSPIDEAGLLRSLRSVRDPGLRFVLTPAEAFFADYRQALMPVLTAPVTHALASASDRTELDLYLVLTIGESLADTTANLRAPLAVDPDTGRAIQVILDDDALPMRQPLPTP